MLRTLAPIVAMAMVCPAIAQAQMPGGGRQPVASVASSPEGSLDEWRATCGRAGILRGLVADGKRNTRQRMPYPATEAAGLSTFGRPVNAERMFRHLRPQIRAAVQGLGIALMKSGALDPALRELVIVRVGYLSPSLYEVHHHASFATSLGVPKKKVANMACISPKGLNKSEAAAIALTDQLVRVARPSDTALAAVRSHFSDSQVLELVTVVGNWMMAARVLETTGVGVDEFAIGDQGIPEGFKD